MNVTAQDVQSLRRLTSAGMMDCKRALENAGGDMQQAQTILKNAMGKQLTKLATRDTAEGTVQTYTHSDGTIAAVVHVECNTDFVARNDDFVNFAKELALQVAAARPLYISAEEIPQALKDREVDVWRQQLAAEGKDEKIIPRILDGKLAAWTEEIVLLEQVHVNTGKYDGKTIEQMRSDLSVATGENIVIKRFCRFAVGE